MDNYSKARKLINNGSFLIDYADKHPDKVFTAATTAKLIDARPGVARALLAGLTRDGELKRVERGAYARVQGAPVPPKRRRTRKAAQAPAARPTAPPAPQGQPTRREVVMSEEVVRALTETLLRDCALTLVRDREAFIATLNDQHNGITVAQNRSPALATMDVVGKWQRTHR